MRAAELYRAKAVEYGELAKTANSPEAAREFKRREGSFTVLADNEQWLADHREQTVHTNDTLGAKEAAPILIGDPIRAAAQ
jgi:hypothetical protein